MSDRAARPLAWLALAAVSGLLLGGLVLEWATRNVQNSQGLGLSGIAFVVTILMNLTFFSFAGAGVVIALRRPGNPIGWMLLAIGLGWSLVAGSIAYGDYAFKLHPGSLPIAAAVTAMGMWVWAPPVAITGVFLLLVYPDGHLAGPRWRWVAYLCGAAVGSASSWTCCSRAR